MDVPANRTIETATLHFVCNRLLETRDVVHRVLDLVLQIVRERPVVVAKDATNPIEVPVHVDREVVRARTERGEPRTALDDTVELIAVQHEQALTARSGVHAVAHDLEVAKHRTRELTQVFVVVTGHIDDTGAVLGFT